MPPVPLPMRPPSGPQTSVAPATGNPGDQAAAMAEVREAISLLEKNLTRLPTGSDPYNAVLESVKRLAKEFPATSAVPGVQRTALAGLAQKVQQDGMMKQLMAAKAAQGGQPQAGGPPAAQPQPAM